MTYQASTPADYIAQLPPDRIEPITRLFDSIQENLPPGFEPTISYGMIGFVVPHSLYPSGYHCKPSDPLPYIALASQKNAISYYNMALYSDPMLLDWFLSEYPKHSNQKLDMGKSCIRFKKMDQIPYNLIAELSKKLTPLDWISHYERVLKK